MQIINNMPTKRGLDKYLSPYGFWDEFITSTVIGVGILFLNWARFPEVAGNKDFFIAFLVGLLCGQIVVCLVEISRAMPNSKVLRYSVRLFWPLSFAALLILSSRAVAYGYYSGLGITFCFGFALIALFKKYNKNEKAEYTPLG